MNEAVHLALARLHWLLFCALSGIELLGILHACHHLEELGQLIKIVGVFASVERQVVQEVALLSLRQVNPVLLVDFEEFAACNEIVLTLAHAFVAEAVHLLNLDIVGLHCLQHSLQELRVVEHAAEDRCTGTFPHGVLFCGLLLQACNHGWCLGCSLSQIQLQFALDYGCARFGNHIVVGSDRK